MKSLFTLTMIIGSSILSLAQNTTATLDYNNVDAIISNSGTLFNDSQGSFSGYEIPKGGGVHAMFSAQFWFTAKDVNGALYTTMGGADNLGTDIDHGPFSENGMYADPYYDQPFMISICQSEIDEYVLWWNCTNGQNPVGCENVQQPSADVLTAISDWPGNGNSSLGQSHYLAPYYDVDGNGIYDPINSGDYPLIKGCCATYMIQNDAGNFHTYSGTDPIGIEMHYLFYQFGASSTLYNTTFVDVMAINLGTTNYPEFAHGFSVDGNLGVSSDDYFGSDSLTNTMIFYNGDNMDAAYLANPPALGISALETPSTSILSYGFFPSTASETWNLMNGVQPNGVALLDPNGSPTKFLLSGDPNNGAAWNETSEGYVPGNRRGLMATNQGAFNIGDTVKQTYAIVFSEGGNNLENASNVINLADWAKTFYDTEINDGCDAGAVASVDDLDINTLSIYPNPTSDQFVIEMEGETTIDVSISDMKGREVRTIKDYSNGSLIDLRGNESGVYLVRIESENGQMIRRIVLQ